MSDNMPDNASSFLANLRRRSAAQQTYGGETPQQPAAIAVRECPNCGAARAQAEGVTHCAYCGFEFIQAELSSGLHLSAHDNSKR